MVRVEMPQEGSTVEFSDGQNQFKVPFIMYADFESILEPVLGQNPPDKNPLEINLQTKTSWTKTPLPKTPGKNPQRKLMNTKYILHK